jgi:hypothetical protein
MQRILGTNDSFALMQWAIFTASFLVTAGLVLIRSAFARES